MQWYKYISKLWLDRECETIIQWHYILLDSLGHYRKVNKIKLENFMYN